MYPASFHRFSRNTGAIIGVTFAVLVVIALLAIASFVVCQRRQTRRSHYWSMSGFMPVTPRLSLRDPDEKARQSGEKGQIGLNDEYPSHLGDHVHVGSGIALPLGLPSGQPLLPSESAFHLPVPVTEPLFNPFVSGDLELPRDFMPTPAPSFRPPGLPEPNPFADPSSHNGPQQEQPPKQDILSAPFPTYLPAALVITSGLQPARPTTRLLADEHKSVARIAQHDRPRPGKGILKNAFNQASSSHALNMGDRVTRLSASTDALSKDILERAAASSVMSSGQGVSISSAGDGPLAVGRKRDSDLRFQSIQSNSKHGSLLSSGTFQSSHRSSATPSATFQAGPDLEGRPQPDDEDDTSVRSFFSRLRESRRLSSDSSSTYRDSTQINLRDSIIAALQEVEPSSSSSPVTEPRSRLSRDSWLPIPSPMTHNLAYSTTLTK